MPWAETTSLWLPLINSVGTVTMLGRSHQPFMQVAGSCAPCPTGPDPSASTNAHRCSAMQQFIQPGAGLARIAMGQVSGNVLGGLFNAVETRRGARP